MFAKLRAFFMWYIWVSRLCFVAGPQYATLVFLGRSRKTYHVDAYMSDVDGALVNFDGGAGASSTSPQYWDPPELCFLTDVILAANLTDVKKLQPLVGGKAGNDFLRTAVQLAATVSRAALKIGVYARFTMLQKA